jgi:protein-disulfide isomerase
MKSQIPQVLVGARDAAPLRRSIIWRFTFAILCLFLALPVAAQGDRYSPAPQEISLQGFPQVGYPSALVDVKIYAAFDDAASAQFWAQTSDKLIQRVRNGEIRLIFVPLSGSGGRAAARAALCASEQGVFWPYADQLFAWQAQDGANAFPGERLVDGALALGVSQAQWNTCFTGSMPDAVLSDAQRAASSEVSFNATPYVVVGDSPSLTDWESLNYTINLALGKANSALATQIAATPESDAAATREADTYTYNPLTGDHVAPPLSIQLPADWKYGYDALVLKDIDGIRPIPFAIYQGPVTGGTGTIVLLWGFPNLVVGAPSGGLAQPDVWTDGTRLLRLAVFEEGCNVGTDLRRNYSIGGLQAIGTQFAAVGCPQLNDTRGWFAGLRQFNVNFVFYAYTDPIAAMDAAQPQLQAILDTVQFIMPEFTPEATAAVTSESGS